MPAPVRSRSSFTREAVMVAMSVGYSVVSVGVVSGAPAGASPDGWSAPSASRTASAAAAASWPGAVEEPGSTSRAPAVGAGSTGVPEADAGEALLLALAGSTGPGDGGAPGPVPSGFLRAPAGRRPRGPPPRGRSSRTVGAGCGGE